MKVIVLFLVFLMVFAGVAFAQDGLNSVKNWISGELSLLGAGARYEYMLNEKLSVGANAYWHSFFFVFNELELGASVRYYPFSGRFFVGSGLGFHIHTGLSWVSGVGITPEVGWKFDVGQPGGFFVQPGIKIPITVGMSGGEFGVGFGFVPYCGLGFAF